MIFFNGLLKDFSGIILCISYSTSVTHGCLYPGNREKKEEKIKSSIELECMLFSFYIWTWIWMHACMYAMA